MTLAVKECDHPEVSVVMVTHGAREFTERAISHLVEHTEHRFELIVVDNASDRGTRSWLSAITGVRLLLNDENRGFGPATNQGAAEARGEHLLLLNSDAFVHPGWLDPLLSALDGAGVGAVVPMFLNLDGSLQEAGALLARDGTVMPYGEGDDPELPHYRFPRRIDYGSAACMFMRRQDFLRRGGFDERYAPAYFEDTDFCLRLAQDGLSVVFEPRSRVTHVGQGSDAPRAAVALSERNHRRFFERWSTQLSGRPWTLVNASRQAVIAARDALATPRVLIWDGSCESPAEPLLDALLSGWPRARITWARGPGDLHDWLERGVELAPGDELGWLGERLFHYDLIVHGSNCEREPATVIDSTQPQAPRVSLDDPGGIAGALAVAGIAPER